MEFSISISSHTGKHFINVERIYLGESIERYKVSHGDKSIVLRNNWPLYKIKKAKKLDWKIENGKAKNTQTMAMMILEIEKKIKAMDLVNY